MPFIRDRKKDTELMRRRERGCNWERERERWVVCFSFCHRKIYEPKNSVLVRPFLDSGETGCHYPDKNFNLKVVKSEGLYFG